MEGWIFLGAIGCTVALVNLLGKRRELAKRARVLELTAKVLGGGHNGDDLVWGDALGTNIKVRFGASGEGNTLRRYTELSAQMPETPPLILRITRREMLEHVEVKLKRLVDVDLGDEEFHRSFVVEAAPEAVVRLLIDEDARAFLSWAHSVELELQDRGVPRLYLKFLRWLDSPQMIEGGAKLLARITARAAEAFDQVERSIKPVVTGDPYRPIIDDSPVHAAAAERAEELERIRRTRAKRGKF